MAYTKYSLTPANNNAAPPDGAPEGMLPSAVNDTMRDMMAQIRDCGDGIRGGTYTMTAPVITGGSINGATIGAGTASTGAFTTLSASSTVSGTGFSNYFASPPALGGTAAAAVSSTNLSYTGTLTGGTGVVNLGSGQFYKDASGNVGIGITTPVSYANYTSLQINGTNGGVFSLRNTANTAYFEIGTNTTETYIKNVSATPLTFATSNTERMRIDSSGNVGIGTASPGTRLDILNTTRLRLDVTSSMAGIAFWKDSTPTYASNIGNAVPGGSVTNDMVFSTFASSVWSERMRIGSGGGMTLYGSIGNTTLSSDGARISFSRNSTNYITASDAAGALSFGSGGTDSRLFIASNGTVLVNAGSKTSSDGILAVHGNAGASGSVMEVRNTGNALAGRDFIRFYSSTGAEAGSIENTTATSTSYLTSSDYRLKEDIKPMTGALDKVMQLKPCTYVWKEDKIPAQGFIAHELQEVVPECVSGVKDGVRVVDEVDAEGKVIGTKEEPAYQGIDTSFLVATLSAAIQEQQAMIQELKAKVAALEAA